MYKIVIDSCGELTQELKEDGHYVNVPLEMDINGYRVVDDETFDQADFLKRVKESPVGPKSSCPDFPFFISHPAANDTSNTIHSNIPVHFFLILLLLLL